MAPDTLEALKLSIAHWDRLAKGTPMPRESIGPKSCALCGLFFKIYCRGCPVRDRTLKGGCDGTPYSAAFIAYAAHIRNVGSGEAFRAAAAAERDFLITLLPEGETWQ